MRYEMREQDDGWIVWDTMTDTPAVIGGRRQEGLSLSDADDVADLLNGEWSKEKPAG